MSGGGSSGLLTDESSDFGKPGTYELYRAGELDAPNGMIFLSASLGESNDYAQYRTITNPDGSKRLDPLSSIERYKLDIKNPLVVSEDTDRNNLVAAWKALHPGQDPKLKTSGMPARKWQQMDRQNAKALENSDYDAIIYKKPNGRHEVQIPKSSRDSLKLTKKVNRPGISLGKDGKWHGIQGAEYRYDKGRGWTLTKEPGRNPFTGKKITIPKFIKE